MVCKWSYGVSERNVSKVCDIKGGTETGGVWSSVLKRISAQKRAEVTAGWRKWNNEKLRNL
jgi:hypothetical protein